MIAAAAKPRSNRHVLAELRRECAPVRAAWLDTIGSPPMLHRADHVELAPHDASNGPCACLKCDDARRLQIRLTAARIMARLELAAMGCSADNDQEEHTDELSGERLVETERPAAVEERRSA